MATSLHVTAGLRVDPEARDRRRDRRGRRLPEAADRGVLHDLDEVLEERPLVVRRADRPARREPLEELLLALRPHAAGDALAAGLGPEEGRDPPEDVAEVGRLVEDEHRPRAERSARGAHGLEGERHGEPLGADEDARRTAEEHGLERAAALDSAREREELAERPP